MFLSEFSLWLTYLLCWVASHCVIDQKNGQLKRPSEVKVSVNLTSLDSSNIERFTYDVRSVYPHPKYDNMTLSNDIAILRLATPLFLDNQFVKSACFDFADRTYDLLLASGYGDKSIKIETLDDEIIQLDIAVNQ